MRRRQTPTPVPRCFAALPAAIAALLLLPTVLAAGVEDPGPDRQEETAPAAPDRPAQDGAPPAQRRVIEVHLGIRELAFIGQPLADLVKRFPDAEVLPFAGQDDAVTVKIAASGISCIAVGEPGELKVASVGVNLDGLHEGMSEAGLRTGQGIGKGSTVNDLLEAYGRPLEILDGRPHGRPRRGAPPPEDPSVPKMYQYASEDGAVKTYFLVQDHLVKRVVVNELATLDRHIVKARPKK